VVIIRWPLGKMQMVISAVNALVQKNMALTLPSPWPLSTGLG